MNASRKTHIEKWISGVTAVLISLNLLLVGSCARQARVTRKEPPKPETPVSTLSLPEPVRFEEIKGRATLPNELKLGFALDLGGTVLAGRWDVEGKVTAIDDKTVTFLSDRGETGHLVYRLPEGLRLSLSSGQPLRIQRTSVGHGATLGYNLIISDPNSPLVVSGRLFGPSPQASKIIEGVSLAQSQTRGQILSRSTYEVSYEAPVTLGSGSERTMLATGKPTEVTLQRRPYVVLVSQTSEQIPSKKYEGVAEGQRYVLEYVIALK